MSNENKYEIRVMTIDDYDEVYSLWQTIHGFGIRSIDDSREGVLRFLKRNPTTSVVAVEDGKIVGAILCGHDGRRGCLYHVCVKGVASIISNSGARTKIYGTIKAAIANFAAAKPVFIGSAPEIPAPA